jgi:hypothetical protein
MKAEIGVFGRSFASMTANQDLAAPAGGGLRSRSRGGARDPVKFL